MSNATAVASRPSGNTINMGWTACPRSLALLSMEIPPQIYDADATTIDHLRTAFSVFAAPDKALRESTTLAIKQPKHHPIESLTSEGNLGSGHFPKAIAPPELPW